MIGRRDDGPILHLRFAGTYPEGSLGNDAAAKMHDVTSAAVVKHAPAAVVFDLLEVEYRWGDAICQLALPLRREDGGFLPARILVQGRTAAALAPLLGPDWLLGAAGVLPSASLAEALEELA